MNTRLKEIIQQVKELVPQRWSNDCGIGTPNGNCCILGCVSVAENLGTDSGVLGYDTGLLRYPEKDDPIVIALSETIPQDFVDWYNNDMLETYGDDETLFTRFENLPHQDRVVTYNDEALRELAEIEAWVERAEAWLEENDR